MPSKFQKRILLCATLCAATLTHADQLEDQFRTPPPEARPRVLWMWMGSNVSSNGITRDLQALHDAGFGGATLFSLADVCTPWARAISNSPIQGVVTFEDSWWQLIRHATLEAKRLSLDFGVHNCAGYESSGGPWITPELSMQEVVWSATSVRGPTNFAAALDRAKPDLHAVQPYPVHNPLTGKLERPEIPARREFYRDIAVLAVPATGNIALGQVVNVTSALKPDGRIEWNVPAGDWIIYRFGHTTMGKLLQPAQWEAIGLECDKMSRAAVEFHLDHIINDARQHLGDLVGNGFNYYHFDSYEARTPGWTPKMAGEFQTRRGYDLISYLPVIAHRTVESETATKKFRDDFEQTIRDLYRENYFPVIREKLHAAGLEFMCEPYGGPWNHTEVVPHVDRIVTEFWTTGGGYEPFELAPTVAAVRAAGRNLIEAEAYTGKPEDSQWTETPAWLKPIGDAAFCGGVNRMVLHRFTHQSFDPRWRPGMVMGQWGTHFDPTQTWWEPGKAWVAYLARCQALLQWGEFVSRPDDFKAREISNGIKLRSIRRHNADTNVFFVANLSRTNGTANCAFEVTGKQPELWDPVSGTIRPLPDFKIEAQRTVVPLQFAAAESFFIVFRNPIASAKGKPENNFPVAKTIGSITGPWQVSFDPKWGGPAQVAFDTLTDWTQRPEASIKYYSGTATYTKRFDLPTAIGSELPTDIYLNLGIVRELAEVTLNGKNLGVIWTAPWRVNLTSAVRPKNNKLEIKVTNAWVNRLVGDEQQPADCDFGKGDFGFGGPLKRFPDWFVKGEPRPSPGRYTFTTWNYFSKTSALIPSGLLGPVILESYPER